MWGPETCHPQPGGKQGRDHPDFRKKTVTFGGKELPREDCTPSDGRRFEQTLPAFSAGADVALRAETWAHHTLEVLRATLGPQWVSKLKQPVRHMPSFQSCVVNFWKPPKLAMGHSRALEKRCRKVNLEMVWETVLMGRKPGTSQGAMKVAPVGLRPGRRLGPGGVTGHMEDWEDNSRE